MAALIINSMTTNVHYVITNNADDSNTNALNNS